MPYRFEGKSSGDVDPSVDEGNLAPPSHRTYTPPSLNPRNCGILWSQVVLQETSAMGHRAYLEGQGGLVRIPVM